MGRPVPLESPGPPYPSLHTQAHFCAALHWFLVGRNLGRQHPVRWACSVQTRLAPTPVTRAGRLEEAAHCRGRGLGLAAPSVEGSGARSPPAALSVEGPGAQSPPGRSVPWKGRGLSLPQAAPSLQGSGARSPPGLEGSVCFSLFPLPAGLLLDVGGALSGGAAGQPDRQVRAKGRRSAGLLGRPAAAASVYGHTTLNAPDLV